MTLQERITALESQLQEWQGRRTQASEQLQQAQAAILQLQGALTLARALAEEAASEAAQPVGSPNDETNGPLAEPLPPSFTDAKAARDE